VKAVVMAGGLATASARSQAKFPCLLSPVGSLAVIDLTVVGLVPPWPLPRNRSRAVEQFPLDRDGHR
jgi:hypothetical protein